MLFRSPLSPTTNFLLVLFLVCFLAILTNTRAIVVWTLFQAVFIFPGMSRFLKTYFLFPPVYHPLPLTIPRHHPVAILSKQPNFPSITPRLHPLLLLSRQPILQVFLPRQPFRHFLLPRQLSCFSCRPSSQSCRGSCFGRFSCRGSCLC